MEKLNKPKFFSHSSFIDIIGIIGFMVSIAQFFIPEKILSLKYKIFIFSFCFFICIIIYFIQYIINWIKFYENYSISLDKYLEQYNDLKNRHLALAEQFNKKNEVIKSQDNLIHYYDFVLNNILTDISLGLLPINKYEKKYLKKLYELTSIDISQLYKLKGGLENGRNNI